MVRKVPPPPNYLVRAEADCLGKTIQVFVEAFIPVALMGVWTAVSPGWKDIIRMVTGRSWSHKIRRKMQEAEEAKPNWITKTGRWFGNLLPVIDRVLWFMAVVEGASFALSHWTSMAWRLHPCVEPGDSLWGTSDVPLDGRPGNDEWQGGPSFVTQAGNITPFISPFMSIPAGWVGTLAIAAHAEGLGIFGDVPISLRIRDETGRVLDFDNWDGEHYDDRFNGPAVYAKIHGGTHGHSLFCDIRISGGPIPVVWFVTRGYASASLYNTNA